MRSSHFGQLLQRRFLLAAHADKVSIVNRTTNPIFRFTFIDSQLKPRIYRIRCQTVGFILSYFLSDFSAGSGRLRLCWRIWFFLQKRTFAGLCLDGLLRLH